MTRDSALSCSMRAFCRSEFWRAFLNAVSDGNAGREAYSNTYLLHYAVCILPLDITEEVIELRDNVRQTIHLGFRAGTASGGRYGSDFGIFIGKDDLLHGPLLDPVAFQINGLENTLGKVILVWSRQLRDQEVQEYGPLFPFGIGIRKDRRQERVGPKETLGLAFEIHLSIFVEFFFVRCYAGIQDGVELVDVRTVQVLPREDIYLFLGIDLGVVEIGLQIVQLVGIGLLGQDRGAVEFGERVADGVGIVQEVQDEDVVLVRMGAVQARQGLYGLDARKRLVDVHRMQQLFVVTRLEFVRADQESVGILLEPLFDLTRRKAVKRRLADLRPTVFVFAGEGDQGLVRTLPLFQVVADGVKVLDRPFDAVGDDHGPRLSADPVLDQYVFVEMVHHDLGLEPDGVVASFHEAPQFLLGLLRVELRVVLYRLGEFVVTLHRRVMGEHVQDEPFLDRLLHGVTVEGPVLEGTVGLRLRIAEGLQRLVLGRGGKGEVAGVGQQLAALHQVVDLIFEGIFHDLFHGLREYLRHGRARAASLTGMSLVDDDGETPALLLFVDLVEDEWKLLHGGDDDLLTVLDELLQVSRTIGMPQRRAYLCVLPDRIVDLSVQYSAVRDDDDRVEDELFVHPQPDQLMGKPGDGVALPAAGRMLDQVALSHSGGGRVGQKLANHVELVVPRPRLGPSFLVGLRFAGHDHLGIVLQDVGQTLPGQHFPPQVVGLDPVRIGRVARPVVPSEVKGQEPGCLPLEVRAKPDFALVHREMGYAPAEFEQLLLGIPIQLVLLNGVAHGLLGEAVLQFESEHWETVDEQTDIQGPLRLVVAVTQLPGHGESVQLETLFGLLIPGRRGTVKQVQVERLVFQSVTQNINRSTFADFVLQPSKKLLSRGVVLGQCQRVGRLGLRINKERRELNQIDAVRPVVVVGDSRNSSPRHRSPLPAWPRYPKKEDRTDARSGSCR